MKELLELRLATLQDAECLLLWRNDVETRKFSINKMKITEHQHMEWLHQSLSNPQRKLYIVECQKQPVGTVRVDTKKDCHYISWTVAPDYRGKGIAKNMVKLLVNKLKGRVVAEILPLNTASIKVAEYAGLTFKRLYKDKVYYELTH
ncbi:MAG: hypothetical protein B7X50_09155 [Alishewanella sp. 34-51-39]|nr:MAG: hypothetical protein B7X50_09155 [Alishewanella sp. 34-51-39]